MNNALWCALYNSREALGEYATQNPHTSEPEVSLCSCCLICLLATTTGHGSCAKSGSFVRSALLALAGRLGYV